MDPRQQLAHTPRVVEQKYVFDQGREGERERLAVIERYLDGHSIARLEAVGLAAGWRCLDVGAGGGSLTRWICRRVGREGSVLAVDLDPRFLEEIEEPNLEVRRLDLLTDELPRDAFDLVHARYVLEHVPERETVLRRLVRTLRPGGVIVVTDAGGVPPRPVAPSEVFDRVLAAFAAVVGARGWCFEWAPTAAEHLRELGLEDVGGESFRRYETDPREGVRRLTADTLVVLRDALVAAGSEASDIDATLAMLRDPKCAMLGFETWTAWGRRGV
jgi:2-polyprenyl-3-methyl-5-hydroxy-6-metoxy-1,4-benzoquinol methylase